ncbi:hypothetical protein SDC9_64514 [bioreactor metagenome]|uniref:CBM-cenC domain-containing protein n=1 Tax=bioreactor metagenome TaxID=1076179 RepID=A0A644XQQ6_9ZZZZ
MISDKRYDPAYCGTINAARVALEALQTEYAGKLAVLESTGIPIHASTHATGGDDPVTPASIGAADTSHADTHVIGGTDALNAMPYDAVPTNLLINENFDFWQYGTRFSATGYTADRWKLTLGTSMAITATQQAFTVGQTDVPDEPTYFMQLAISNAGSADGFFEQRIESVRTRAGATIAYSFYAKCTATTYGAKVRMVQNFGTGGSVDVATADQDITLTTSWQKFTGTFTLDSISGKTIGADNYLALRIVLPTASGTKTIQIAKGQANRGTVALPSVSRNQTDGLRLCQRYCQLVSFNTLAAIYSTGFARTTSIGFPSMRVAPTCTVTSISFIGKDGTPSTLYLAQSDFNSISLIYNWTGGTVGKAFTATGALALKSEL